MELIPFSQQICQQYGNHFYLEESPLLTDLFPISLNKGKYNIIYYRQEESSSILRLKKESSSYWSSRHIRVRRVGRLQRSTVSCCPTRRRQSSGILHKMRKKSSRKPKERRRAG